MGASDGDFGLIQGYDLWSLNKRGGSSSSESGPDHSRERCYGPFTSSGGVIRLGKLDAVVHAGHGGVAGPTDREPPGVHRRNGRTRWPGRGERRKWWGDRGMGGPPRGPEPWIRDLRSTC